MLGITIIGPGRLGGALALALVDAGFRIDALVYRSRKGVKELASKLEPSPQLLHISEVESVVSTVVMLAAQDEDLPSAVDILRNKIKKGSVVLQTSGSLSSSILDPLRADGAAVASFHPLSSVSSWKNGHNWFKGAFFAIEGDVKAQSAGRRLAKALGGQAFAVNSIKKPLYHAAALIAAGHVTALFDIALELAVEAGLDRRQARRVLQPLLTTVAANLAKQDTPAALTGTYARGDEATSRRHLAALKKSASRDARNIYIDLARRSIDLAEKRGLEAQKVKKLRTTIKLAKRG